jgi:hypothetical protein
MSFKKPFRASPVVLGEFARAKNASEGRKKAINTVLYTVMLAVVVFSIGMAITNPSLIKQLFPRIYSFFMSPEERQRIEGTAYYPGCDAARSAGVAPIYRGTPGYRSEMDGDNDGIACEPHSGW